MFCWNTNFLIIFCGIFRHRFCWKSHHNSVILFSNISNQFGSARQMYARPNVKVWQLQTSYGKYTIISFYFRRTPNISIDSIFISFFSNWNVRAMNCIKIDINICRVCLQSTTGCSIFSDDILEKFRFTTLVHVSSCIYYKKINVQPFL